MSAYMLPNKTISIIACYMMVAARPSRWIPEGMRWLELSDDFRKCLADAGLKIDEESDTFDGEKIHAYLYAKNRAALIALYGEKSVDEEDCPEKTMPQDDVSVDTKEETRREWLSNLYTVCRCYKYQISEGDYESDPFYRFFGEWINRMAAVLADYVVAEVRPKGGANYRTWDEF